MNRYLRQVFLSYAAALLAAFTFVPWYGTPLEPWASTPSVRYAPFWRPPETIGYLFHFDAQRLFLEGISLSIVFVVGMVSLWGEEPKEGERAESSFNGRNFP